MMMWESRNARVSVSGVVMVVMIVAISKEPGNEGVGETDGCEGR